MTDREEDKKGEGKGFAGLSTLVSDVDTTPPHVAKVEPPAAVQSAGRPVPQATQTQPSQQHQTYQEPAQPPSSGSSGGKWVLGIAVAIGVLWFIGQLDKSPTSPAPAYSPPVQTPTPSYTPPVQIVVPSDSPPAEPQASSRPQETMPPVGQDLVFSVEQIRYCLAEDIRMEGAKSVLNSYIDSDVDRYNAMVADYNSRCSQFRYYGGALESARRDIDSYRMKLEEEGRNNFTRQINGANHEISPSIPSGTQSTEVLSPAIIFPVPSAQDYFPSNWTWGEFRKRIGYHRLGVDDQAKTWFHYRNNVIPIIASIDNKNIVEEQENFDKLIPVPGFIMPLSGSFIVKSVKANVRSEPSSDDATSYVVEVLVNGDFAIVVGYSADFFKVTTLNGNVGYIHRSVGVYTKSND